MKVKMCTQEFGVKKFIWVLKEILPLGLVRTLNFDN